MQYLLSDLIKMSLDERLSIIEKMICSLSSDDKLNKDELDDIVERIRFWKNETKAAV